MVDIPGVEHGATLLCIVFDVASGTYEVVAMERGTGVPEGLSGSIEFQAFRCELAKRDG